MGACSVPGSFADAVLGCKCAVEPKTTFPQQAGLPSALRAQANGPWEDESAKKRKDRIAFLKRKADITRQDLLVKFEDQDYHGVQDCASDLRDIVSELVGLEFE